MKIDVYDFDKTIYDGDSTIDFYLYSLKKDIKLIRYLPIQIIYFLKYKMKLVDKETFKEKFFIFLKGIRNVENNVTYFWKENKNKIRYNIIKNTENEKYIISASPEFLLQDICHQIGKFNLIATKVNKLNGKFESKNCYGEEKVNRLKKVLKENFKIENFYSDSISDKYLAEIAENSYLVKKGGKVEIYDFNRY